MKRIIILLIAVVLVMASCMSSSSSKGTSSSIRLRARDAELETESQLVYEEGPDRDCIGWWTHPNDKIKWTFDVADAGSYIVVVKVACASSFAGSKVGVTVAGQTLEFDMPDTNEWESYNKVEVGTVDLESGSHTLVVQGIELANRFYGNLQDVYLKKVG
jgi:uncharacterized protein YaiE (UPF0345 family)